MRGRTATTWWGVAIDAPDPVALAEFYAEVLGWPVSHREEHGAAIGVPGTTSFIRFQREANHVAPTWPAAGADQQMQLHLDVAVDDLDAATQAALERGARLAEHQPQRDVRVLLDPAGHPFCLYLDTTP